MSKFQNDDAFLSLKIDYICFADSVMSQKAAFYQGLYCLF